MALTMKVTIPPNTTAIVYVPSKNEKEIIESDKAISQSKGVKFIRYENGYSVYKTGSGNYRFISNL